MGPSGDLRRVLVVDDDKVVADSLTAILCRQGYTAQAAYSAGSAISAAKNTPPDTVISDVLMPEMNGLELAEYFTEHHPQCQVVLMSGDASAEGLLDTALRQSHPYPTQHKPVGLMQIFEMLSSLVPVV